LTVDVIPTEPPHNRFDIAIWEQHNGVLEERARNGDPLIRVCPIREERLPGDRVRIGSEWNVHVARVAGGQWVDKETHGVEPLESHEHVQVSKVGRVCVADVVICVRVMGGTSNTQARLGACDGVVGVEASCPKTVGDDIGVAINAKLDGCFFNLTLVERKLAAGEPSAEVPVLEHWPERVWPVQAARLARLHEIRLRVVVSRARKSGGPLAVAQATSHVVTHDVKIWRHDAANTLLDGADARASKVGAHFRDLLLARPTTLRQHRTFSGEPIPAVVANSLRPRVLLPLAKSEHDLRVARL